MECLDSQARTLDFASLTLCLRLCRGIVSPYMLSYLCSIQNVKITTDRLGLIWFVNTNAEPARMSQNINDIALELGGKGIVEVARNVNICEFFC